MDASSAAILQSPLSADSSSFEPSTPISNANERDLSTSTPSNFQNHMENSHSMTTGAHLQVDSASSAFSSKPTSVDLSAYSSNASTPTSMSSIQYSFNTNYSGGSGSMMSVSANKMASNPAYNVNKYLNIDQLRFELLKQLEYYFSKRNLSTDDYLLGQMDKDFYVPIAVIAGFKKVTQLTADINMIVDCIHQSTQLELDPSASKVRSIGGASGGDITVSNASNLNDLMQQQQAKQQRSKIIMREVSLEATEEQVKALFNDKEPECTSCLQCEKAGADSWYITFANEDQAQRALQYLKFSVVTFLEKPIKARIKSHGMPRSNSNFTPGGSTPGSQQLSVSNTPPPQSIMYSSASSSAQSPSQMQTQGSMQMPYIQSANAGAYPYIQQNLPQINHHQQQLIHLQASQQQQYNMLSQANQNYVHRLNSHGMAQSPNQYIVPNGQQVIAISQQNNGALAHQSTQVQGQTNPHQQQWLASSHQYWQGQTGAPQPLIQTPGRQIDRAIVYSPLPNQHITIIPQYGIVSNAQNSTILPLQVQTPPITNNNQLSPRNTPHSAKQATSPSVSPGVNSSSNSLNVNTSQQTNNKSKEARSSSNKVVLHSPSKSSTPLNTEMIAQQPVAFVTNSSSGADYPSSSYNHILSIAPHQIAHVQSPHAPNSSIGTPQPYFPIQLVNPNFNNAGQQSFYSGQVPQQQNSTQMGPNGQQYAQSYTSVAPHHFIIQPQFATNGQQSINVSIASSNPQAIHGVYNTNGANQIPTTPPVYPYQIAAMPVSATAAGNVNVNSIPNSTANSVNQQNEVPVYFQPYSNGLGGYVPNSSNFKSANAYEIESGAANNSSTQNGPNNTNNLSNLSYQTVNNNSNGDLQNVYTAAVNQQMSNGASSADTMVIGGISNTQSSGNQPQAIYVYNHLLQAQPQQQHVVSSPQALPVTLAQNVSNSQPSTSPLLVTTSSTAITMHQQQYTANQQTLNASHPTTPSGPSHHQPGQSFHHNPHHAPRRGGGGGNGAGSYNEYHHHGGNHHQRNVNLSSRSKYPNNQSINVVTDQNSGSYQALSPNSIIQHNLHHGHHQQQHSPRHYHNSHHSANYTQHHHQRHQSPGKANGNYHGSEHEQDPVNLSENKSSQNLCDTNDHANQHQAVRTSAAINSADFPPLKSSSTSVSANSINNSQQPDPPIDPAIISISKDINSIPDSLSHLKTGAPGVNGPEAVETQKQTVNSLLSSLQQQHQKQTFHERTSNYSNNSENFHHGLKHSNSNQLNPVNQYHHSAHHSSSPNSSISYHHGNASGAGSGAYHHAQNGHSSSGYFSPNGAKSFGRKHQNHGQHQYESSSYSGNSSSPSLNNHSNSSSYTPRYRNPNTGRSSHHSNIHNNGQPDQSSPYGHRNRNKPHYAAGTSVKGSSKHSNSPPISPTSATNSDQSNFAGNSCSSYASEPIAIVNNISPSSNFVNEDDMNLANSLGKKLTFAEIVQRQNNGLPISNSTLDKPYKPSNLALGQQGSLSKDSSAASSSKSSSAVTTPTSSTTFATPSTSSMSSTSANQNATGVDSYLRGNIDPKQRKELVVDDEEDDDEMTLSVDADNLDRGELKEGRDANANAQSTSAAVLTTN